MPTGPEAGLKLVTFGGGVTVKRTPLLATPPTVTTTFPVVAPAGTCTVMFTELQPVVAIGPAGVPLKVTVLVPCGKPKFAPEITTNAPTAAAGGLKLVMLGGGGTTVKLTPLLDTLLLRDTTTAPVVAPAGTVTEMLVSLQLVGVADVPLKLTVPVPCVAPKLVPVIVTGVPAAPDVGLKPVIVGGGITVKETPLLVPLLVVTTKGPLVAPLGMNVTMLASLQLATPNAVPLKETVLSPCAPPKFFPVIVTDVPKRPDGGFRLVMVGGERLKFTPLLTVPTELTVTVLAAGTPAGTSTTMLV